MNNCIQNDNMNDNETTKQVIPFAAAASPPSAAKAKANEYLLSTPVQQQQQEEGEEETTTNKGGESSEEHQYSDADLNFALQQIEAENLLSSILLKKQNAALSATATAEEKRAKREKKEKTIWFPCLPEDDLDGIEESLRPTLGKFRDVIGPNGPITIQNPAVDPYWQELDPFALHTLKYAAKYMQCHAIEVASHEDATSVPIPKYSGFLLDNQVLKVLNQQVNGMMAQWRLSVMDLLTLHRSLGVSIEGSKAERQFNFAKFAVPQAMDGVAKFDRFPVAVMNVIALRRFVVGVDNDEVADLVFRMANCDRYKIIAKPFMYFNVFEVWTVFYGDSSVCCTRAYGREEGYKIGVNHLQIESLLQKQRQRPQKKRKSSDGQY